LIVKLSESETVGASAIKYTNRLSDFLFVAARFANLTTGDVLWIPGANRG
jgi:cob(I)alamin adenosyltransferase